MSHLLRTRRTLASAATLTLTLAGLVAFTPTAHAADGGLIINEFYGRGGSANQPFTNKFVELYNPTAAPISLSGVSLQYRAATSTGNATGVATLTGSVAPKGYFLVQLNSNGTTGAALPTPDQVTSLAPSGTTGTVFIANATTAINPDSGAVIDKLGYGGSNSPETAPAAYPGTNSTPGSLTRTNFVDTDDNSKDFTFAPAPTPQNSSSGTTDPGPGPGPQPETVAIAAIQGAGAATPMAGRKVTTQGVVTAAYPTGGFRGVYIQTPGTGGTAKAAGAASDGIFVFSDKAAAELKPGECINVTGTPAEYFTLTQLADVTFTKATGCAPVTSTPINGVPATDAAKEPYEGMLVQPKGTYTITNNYELNQFGQLGLAAGIKPLYTATDMVEPGAAATAYEGANQAKYITLDGGSSWNYMTNATAKASPLPYLSAAEPHRTASQVSFTKPVILDYRFQWNFQPTGQVVGASSAFDPIAPENDRERTVPHVGGNVQIAAFNVLNYFTDLGKDEAGCRSYNDMYGTPRATNNCQVRGAWSQEAFNDQKSKIVTAINGTQAEVVALMEIENSAGVSYVSHARDFTLAELVTSLNAAAGSQKWAYAVSPSVLPGSEDVIRTAFIYDRKAIQPLGHSQILLDDAFANARYPLAQKFKATNTGKPFVTIANHFKSKGSGADDGTGQGLSNPSREAQARALTAWAGKQFAGEAVFLMGDFNAYSKETPVQIIEKAGYTNTAKKYEPASATYQFSGRLGSLDHVFANAAAMRLVTGAAAWDINGDESIAFQYSRRLYNVTDFHAPDQFASSDHDPVVVGLNTGPRGR